jgi:hypothetical protein
MEKSERYVLHDLRTLHIIELSKLPPHSRGRLASWLKFILARRKEELMALVKENPELQYACNVLAEVNSTAEVRALYEVDLKRWRDEQDRTEYAVQHAVQDTMKQVLDLVKQGYSAEQIETMLHKP